MLTTISKANPTPYTKRFTQYIMMMAVIGCAATPVGSAPPGPVNTKLYCFGPPDMTFQVRITSASAGAPIANGTIYGFTPQPSLNNTSRPADIPEDYVAYGMADGVNFGPYSYTGDLEYLSSISGNFEHQDQIDGWTGGDTLVLIH